MQPIDVRPVGDLIFVLPKAAPTQTAGGIHIPQSGVPNDPTNPRSACEGEVLAVGNGAWTKKLVFVTPDVKVGDRVLFSRFSGKDVTLDGRDLKVLAECEIIATLEPDAVVNAFNELQA